MTALDSARAMVAQLDREAPGWRASSALRTARLLAELVELVDTAEADAAHFRRQAEEHAVALAEARRGVVVDPDPVADLALLTELPLSGRTKSVCARRGYVTAGDVRARTDAELLRRAGIGRIVLTELRSVLAGRPHVQGARCPRCGE